MHPTARVSLRLAVLALLIAVVGFATPQQAHAWFGYEVYVTARWEGASSVTCKDAGMVINGQSKNYSVTKVDNKTCRAKFVDVQDGTAQYYINAIEGQTWFNSGRWITTGWQKSTISGGSWWQGKSIWIGPIKMNYPR